VVTIGTTAASASVRKAQLDQQNSFKRWTGAGGVAIAGLLMLGIPARRRKWRALLGGFIIACFLGILSGCGGSSSNNSNPGTTAGSYSFTVTGADANGLKEQTTINVTVN
jgi:hypothetical protein